MLALAGFGRCRVDTILAQATALNAKRVFLYRHWRGSHQARLLMRRELSSSLVHTVTARRLLLEADAASLLLDLRGCVGVRATRALLVDKGATTSTVDDSLFLAVDLLLLALIRRVRLVFWVILMIDCGGGLLP